MTGSYAAKAPDVKDATLASDAGGGELKKVYTRGRCGNALAEAAADPIGEEPHDAGPALRGPWAQRGRAVS